MYYPKIKNVYRRDKVTHKPIIGAYSTSEFAYLCDQKWCFTEKVHGTNIRIEYAPNESSPLVLRFRGKTDAAQIPDHLFKCLENLFNVDKLKNIFAAPTILCGEGYGHKINGGGHYFQDPNYRKSPACYRA